MNTNTDFNKIDKVLAKITGKELKSFVRVYSYTHDDFATALVEKYWKPERGNYKEMVEACFAHAGVLGKRFGEPDLDWRKIEDDLLPVMRKAVGMKKRGNLIDAAIIAGYVMTTTCGEFKRDHEHYKPVRYDVWAEENKVLKGIVTQAADMGLKNRKEKYFHYRYYIQKADYWIAHGKRAKAEKLMMDKRDDENIRSHYIDCLMEWKEYKKAIEIIDDNKDDFKAQYNKWEDKVVEALKLSGDKEWLIEECRKRCITSSYKLKYFAALKDAVPKEEWKNFLNTLWDEVDWSQEYQESEAVIAIQEKMLDRMKMVFVHHSWNLWEMFAKYVKYVPKKDQTFVGELMSKKICRLALLKEKPKEFAWLLGEVERMMGHSRIADEVIKDGIRNLIKEHPKNYYLKNYLGSVL